jgi:hypothetical protein
VCFFRRKGNLFAFFFWRESFTQKTPEEDEGRVKEASSPAASGKHFEEGRKNITDKNTAHIHKGHCLILPFSFTVCIHPILSYARRFRSTLSRLGRKPSVILSFTSHHHVFCFPEYIFVANFSHFRSN